MDRKTLSGKTVKDLRSLCADRTIKPSALKDDIIDQLVKYEQKQKRLAKKKALTDTKSSTEGTNVEKNQQDTKPVRSPVTKVSKQKDNEKQPVEIKKTADGKYTILQQLGKPGKEGTTFLVKNRKGDEYAMKVFPKQKSINTLLKEVGHQREAARHGIAPQIKEINEEGKYIVMEKLDKNLFDIVKKNNGEIPDTIQRKIANVIKRMDETGVFHGDPNPANFMLKGTSMYMIDYGFARDIDDKLVKKYETNTPNTKFMILGLILKLKEIYREHNPNIEYKVLSKIINC